MNEPADEASHRVARPRLESAKMHVYVSGSALGRNFTVSKCGCIARPHDVIVVHINDIVGVDVNRRLSFASVATSRPFVLRLTSVGPMLGGTSISFGITAIDIAEKRKASRRKMFNLDVFFSRWLSDSVKGR